MKEFLQGIYNRLTVHWISTLRGLTYILLCVMYFMGKIDTDKWITAITFVLASAAFMGKDGDKVVTKKEYKK